MLLAPGDGTGARDGEEEAAGGLKEEGADDIFGGEARDPGGETDPDAERAEGEGVDRWLGLGGIT